MNWLKTLLPKTLFARGLLIVVLPVVLVQGVTVYIFFNRHLDNVSKYMRHSLTGEISFLTYLMIREPDRQHALTYLFDKQTGVTISFSEGASLEQPRRQPFPEFKRSLAEQLDLPFTVTQMDGNVRVAVQLSDGLLIFTTTPKRLQSQTVDIFLWWMMGSSLFFLMIALLFLRNQVRPIRELADAAERFGKGQEIPNFKPSGAAEVRRAGRAFLVMRERIRRQIKTRTDMLAGISHDLRTPLTRMKLQLSMLGGEEAGELAADVTQMEHMIQEYLDFAKGVSGEETNVVSLPALITDLEQDYRRGGETHLSIGAVDEVLLPVREQAFRRMLTNLIDNALRYGKKCIISSRLAANQRVDIFIDDSGAGIPTKQHEEVFRPFTRLDPSRNLNEAGVGLGLTVARDIARNHGGNITLEDAPEGGLRVVVRLPL